jgi:hypothetical protein
MATNPSCWQIIRVEYPGLPEQTAPKILAKNDRPASR